MSRTITVTGVGCISLRPDLVIITMTVESRNKEYQKAVELAAKDIKAIKTALSGIGYAEDNLKTTNFNVQTEHESYQDGNRNWKKRFVGYLCTHALKLEFDFTMEELNNVISALAISRSAPDFQIGFSIKNKAAASEELLTAAVKNASEKAAIIAKAAGVTLGDVESIDYSWDEVHFVSNTRMAKNMLASVSMEDGAIEGMSIEPEKIKADDSVTVRWSIK